MTHVHAKGSVEARLDRLKQRAARATALNSLSDLAAALKGTLDLLSDVLLEDEPKPEPMTAEKAEALTKRAT